MSRRNAGPRDARDVGSTVAALAEIGRTAADGTEDLPDRLLRAAGEVADVLGDACGIGLLSEDATMLDPVLVRHRDADAQAVLEEACTHAGPLPIGGVAGEVLASCRTIFIPDGAAAAIEGRMHPMWRPFLERYPIRSIIMAPLCTRGDALGVVMVARVEGPGYTASDAAALEDLAHRLAILVDRARLFDAVEVALSERTRAESAARFQARLLDEVDACVIATDARRRITHWNRGAEQLLGWRREEVLGRDLVEVGVWATGREQADAIQAHVATGNTWHGECALRRRDGHVTAVLGRVSAVRDDRGEGAGYVGIAVDIADRKRIEDELREGEQRYRSLVEVLEEGVVMIDGDGHVIAANPAAERILNPLPDPLVGRDVADRRWSAVDEEGSPLEFHQYPSSITAATGQPQTGRVVGLKRPDGVTRWLSINTRGLWHPGEDRPHAVVASMTDITERKRVEDQLQHLAEHDALTDLLNRRGLEAELERQLAYVTRYGGELAVLALDLDNFSYVNSTLGHTNGDRLVLCVAELLSGRLRTTDRLARIGGDEFAVLLPHTGRVEAERVADDIVACVRNASIALNGNVIGTSASVGVAHVGGAGPTAAAVLASPSVAVQAAKEAGGDRYEMHSARLQERSELELSWPARIRRAVDGGLLTLHSQPILDLRANRIAQHELLVRMIAEDGGVVPPGDFLPVAERFGLVRDIDAWVTRQAARLVAAHNVRGRDARVEVNISGRTLEDDEFPRLVEAEIASTGIDPAALIFEITETSAITNMDAARSFAERIDRLGCAVALDDFGSGFSSFYYLKRLPASYLKIDGDFVRSMSRSRLDQEVVRAIVQVARSVGHATVAEYVEDRDTLAMVRRYGVDFAQGFFVGRPRPVTEDALAL